MATFNWSIPPFQTDPAEVWQTQCWGPVSRANSCDERSMDNLQCWGVFDTHFCNEVDRPTGPNPNNISGPAAPPAFGSRPDDWYRDDEVSRYASENRRALSTMCFQDQAVGLGDGVVSGSGFKACPLNSV